MICQKGPKLVVLLFCSCLSVIAAAGNAPIELVIDDGYFDPSPYPRPFIVTARFEQLTGPPARGTVTISDGIEQCTIQLPDTYCVFTPSVGGSISLTGTYAGDGHYAATTSPPVMHYVDDGAPELVSYKDTSNSHYYVSGMNDEPDITPDGRYVAYVQQDSGYFYVRRFDRHLQKTDQIFRATSPTLTDPGISADGQRLVLLRSSSTYVYTENSQTATFTASNSTNPTISGDGRWIAFVSSNTNGLPDDTNGVADIFLKNIDTDEIERVSVSSSGQQANLASYDVAISHDARYVAFESAASNLVSGDTNLATDIFLRDRATGTTQRVSVGTNLGQSNGHCISPSISASGRYVSFECSATNLVSGDTNNKDDIFWKDVGTNQLRIVSRPPSGTPGNSHSREPHLSANGRFVTFRSAASNLVSGDSNQKWDSFVWDLSTSQLERVSVASNGRQGDGRSSRSVVSENGRFVAFANISNTFDPDATSSRFNVYLRDRAMQSTNLIGAVTDGFVFDRDADFLGASDDGRYIAYSTFSENFLVGHEHHPHAILRDRQTGQSSVINEMPDGSHPNLLEWSTMSFDGRLLALETNTSLHPDDIDSQRDVYVKNLVTGVFEWVSKDTAQSGYPARYPILSGPGRHVAYVRESQGYVYDRNEGVTQTMVADPVEYISDITPNGRYVTFSNGYELFRYDLLVDHYERVSIDAHGNGIRGAGGSMSADGRHVLFSSSEGLGAVEGGSQNEVFLRNMADFTTIRVSLNPDGNDFSEDSYSAQLARNGRFASFINDNHSFVRDLQEGRTTLVSVDAQGNPANGFSYPRWMSRDGQLIVLDSRADNLAPIDPHSFENDVFIMRNVGANYGPNANSDTYFILEDHALSAIDQDGTGTTQTNDNGLLANDSDDQGDGFSMASPLGPSSPAGIGGTLVAQQDGTFQYSPEPDSNGLATFDYVVTDSLGASSTGAANIHVQGVNDPPSFTPGSQIVVDSATSHTRDWATEISAGPPNEAAQSLTFAVATLFLNGLVFDELPTISPSGTVSFSLSPDSIQHGRATFSVTLSDDGGVDNGGVNQSGVSQLQIVLGDQFFADGFNP